jgi:hypothetical protein
MVLRSKNSTTLKSVNEADIVMPAKAGIQFSWLNSQLSWTPAYAGVTVHGFGAIGSAVEISWINAKS